MRGGTSKGPYFNASDLPGDEAARKELLLRIMGSPDLRQIDGLGGADPLTSKVAIVSRSSRAGVDLDYLFAQVAIDRPLVDTSPSCGNMLAGVAPFGIETGLIDAEDGESRVVIYNVNTASRIEAIVQTPGRRVTYVGQARIDGVPGTAAPIYLSFMDIVGSKTGALLPTGHAIDSINGVDVTCIDVAMPMVLFRASDVGLTGHESRDAIDGNRALFETIEPIRREAGRRMGLGDVSDSVIPKIGLLSAPVHGGHIASRYFTPWKIHAAHAVTGAVCVATATAVEGSVAEALVSGLRQSSRDVCIEHPSGQITVRLETSGSGPSLQVIRAGILRTARLIMRGNVFF